ncbi:MULTISPECIES: NAD(P)/FAD-dependent oxidoreductase [Ramlibacter]|uniref:Flavocytochrome C n=1 Tax=Ramlibacter pinisoli TaxID=2682844 RepID=A0A6N8IQJ0_9BURK|nr:MULTISPECIES: NAD(P)/FAD-dependent oxidoreductase [Ramlibacter]MBA2963585.1 FAD-dependent oxidoreductase [Ramlibacter sp. CGMCC 1.13660]MVQ28550.1 flavocytochrome C [Ramlibacter pinisoli]
MQRRTLLQASGAATLSALAGCASPVGTRPRVVVVGGGYGGATAAKYLRLFSDGRVDVTVVEPQADLVSCPLSNLVLGGSATLAQLTTPLAGLAARHGVALAQDTVRSIDPARKTVTLAGGRSLAYDKLVVSPGVDLQFDRIGGLQAAHAAGAVLQAWKAGPETLALRRQLEAMPDGGVYAIAIPEQPYRCPPGPYERACQVAWYFRQAKPRSKVLVLDANPDVVSKPALFRRAWAELYPGLVEYRPNHKVTAVDARAGLLKADLQDDVRADVLNVLPPMRAGLVAVQAGLANQAGNRWCGVDYLGFESTAAADVHVLGDAILAASGMPKSAHMANNHAKVAAAVIVSRLLGWEAPVAPLLTNTCYSFVDDKRVIHVASVHEYADRTWRIVAGSGGVSPAPTDLEGVYAWNWARTMWADALA